MELSYLQDCPTCGAPVEAAEVDRIVECSFCDGRNYMIARGPLRFVLPEVIPRNIADEDILNVPYLRFKGQVYSCQGTDLQYKIVDATRVGITGNGIPSSLGLRPQAMKIRLVGTAIRGRVVKPTEKIAAIFAKAARLSEIHQDNSSPVYHRSFIGETISIIYLPTYVYEGKLYDGVLNREMTTEKSVETLYRQAEPWNGKWLPQFIPTICPHCAAQMTGRKDSLVMECRNCESLWREERGRFVRVDYTLVSSRDAERHLPFWKISADLQGVLLKSHADFLRMTRQSVVVREEHEKLPFSFWIPAFKIRSKYFLHAAMHMTVCQDRLPRSDDQLEKGLYPVTMPLDEAVQSIKAVLTESMIIRKEFTPKLPQIQVTPKSAEIVYLPFRSLGVDLVQEHSSLALSKSILQYGRAL